MAVERGDSTAPIGGTSNDTPSTFEQSTLAATTSTGNARLIVRDATQIEVIDTGNFFISQTVEGVLAEIAGLTGLDSSIQDQIDAIVIRVTDNELDILSNASAITSLGGRLTTAEATIITNTTGIGTNATNLTTHENDVANPHTVTKTQVGLSNVDNTSDVNKPVSTAQATADGVVASNAEALSIAYAIALGG